MFIETFRHVLHYHLTMQVKRLVNSENVNRTLKTTDQCNYTAVIPLHVAVEHDHVSIVEYLLKVGADVDKTDSSWRTPLDVAVSKKVSLCVIVHYSQCKPWTSYSDKVWIYSNVTMYGYTEVVVTELF